jgi:hypothetical protein
MTRVSDGRPNLGQDVSQASLGELLGEVTRDMSRLVRQEVELAKAELRQEAKITGQAAGMFVGAALAGFMVLLFLSYALWWGLSNVMDQSWAALIVTAIWAVIGAALFAVARTRLRQIRGLRQTTQTVREVPETFNTGRQT